MPSLYRLMLSRASVVLTVASGRHVVLLVSSGVLVVVSLLQCCDILRYDLHYVSHWSYGVVIKPNKGENMNAKVKKDWGVATVPALVAKLYPDFVKAQAKEMKVAKGAQWGWTWRESVYCLNCVDDLPKVELKPRDEVCGGRCYKCREMVGV